MIWRRQTSLLFAVFLLGACASGPPPKPDIPDSISPGWKLSSRSFRPAADPPAGRRSIPGPAPREIPDLLVRTKQQQVRFGEVQRTPAEAQTVKFQVEHYFVLVKWNNAPKANLTALIRAIQKALQPK